MKKKVHDDLEVHLEEYESKQPGFKKEVEDAYKDLRLALKVAEARKQKGFSQRELAHLSGIPQPSIARIERASYPNVSIKTLSKIATALGGQLKVDINL